MTNPQSHLYQYVVGCNGRSGVEPRPGTRSVIGNQEVKVAGLLQLNDAGAHRRGQCEGGLEAKGE